MRPLFAGMDLNNQNRSKLTSRQETSTLGLSGECNIMFTPARDFLLETPWRIIFFTEVGGAASNSAYYGYLLEDYNP
jgi:hypothetical protein